MIEKNNNQWATLAESQVSFILGMGNLLSTKKGNKTALDKVISISLDTIKLNKGCIYLKSGKNKIHYKSSVGFSPSEQKLLKDICYHPKLLDHVIAEKNIVKIPFPNKLEHFSKEILNKLHIETGLFIPILSKDHEGVLFVGDTAEHVLDKNALEKYQLVATQIGQMLGFIKKFQIVSASEKRYRTLMENASCSMFIADMDGNLLETNKEGEKLTGFTKSELIGKKFRDFLTPDFKNQLSQWMKDLETDHYLTPTAIQIQRADGCIRTVEGSVVLVDVGKETLFLMIGTDVTEVNFLRGKALLNDKLATIGLLAAGVAHEINNPIAWILSNFDLLKDHLDEVHNILNKIPAMIDLQPDTSFKIEINNLLSQINENKRFTMLDELLQESMQGAKRIQRIVQDLRNYSRPDTSVFEKIDLHKVLDSAINMVWPEFKYRAQLVKNYAANMPLLTLNEGRVHQVILNLIINAAHSIEEDTSKNKITVTTFLESDRVGVTIADTGKGIDSAHLSKIFDPFFTTKPIGTGTGLGLFICHEIIRNLGGEIIVESKLGEGSRFTIFLPLSSAKPQAKDKYIN